MTDRDARSAEAEHGHHSYVGTRIPWYVHLMWILFWTFAVYYVLRWVFPEIQNAFPVQS